MNYFLIADEFFSHKYRTKILNDLICLYMDLIDKNQFDDNRLSFLDDIFKKSFSYSPDMESEFASVLEETWSEFDKTEYTTLGESTGYTRFTTVILPLFNQ